MKESKIKMVAIWTYETSGVLSDIPLGSVLVTDCDTKTEDQIYSEARDLIAKSMGFEDWNNYEETLPKHSINKTVLLYDVFDFLSDSDDVVEGFNKNSELRRNDDLKLMTKFYETSKNCS